MIKKITFTLFFVAASLGLFSQNFEVPKNYNLDKTENYSLYQQDIVDCVNWLMNTPINTKSEKRKEANTFLLKWLMGSPDVHIDIKVEIVTFMESSPEFLMVFMGGWAKYSIESSDFNNKIRGSLSGINAVIDFYSRNISFLKKDKNIEKYIKMKKKGSLKKYIEKNA